MPAIPMRKGEQDLILVAQLRSLCKYTHGDFWPTTYVSWPRTASLRLTANNYSTSAFYEVLQYLLTFYGVATLQTIVNSLVVYLAA